MVSDDHLTAGLLWILEEFHFPSAHLCMPYWLLWILVVQDRFFINEWVPLKWNIVSTVRFSLTT